MFLRTDLKIFLIPPKMWLSSSPSMHAVKLCPLTAHLRDPHPAAGSHQQWREQQEYAADPNGSYQIKHQKRGLKAQHKATPLFSHNS